MSAESAPATSVASEPTVTARAWYIVGILVLLYAFSCVDRYILALLVEPVSAEFNISDNVQGLMLGAGFAIVYSLTGLPLAHLIDRGQRRVIVAAGATAWGVATLASGFAPNLETLLICRAGVAIGEAVLSPAAVSLISDLFPQNKRSLPVSMYVGTSQLMGVGSFIVGAAALDVATQVSPDVGMDPWRITLIIVGLPSIFLAALIMLTVKEPARIAPPMPHGVATAEADGSLSAFFKHFLANWLLYVPTFLGIGIGALMFYGQTAWLPSLLIRAYGTSASEAGYLLGIVGMCAGLGGAFLWPWIAKAIGKKNLVMGLMLCLIAAAAIGSLGVMAATLVHDRTLALACFALSLTALAAYAPINPILIQTVAPGRMHARLVS
ncbi:MAG: MFS transporter, partial [Hyphomonadaceae bacterium]